MEDEEAADRGPADYRQHNAGERLEIAVEGAGMGTWDWDIATGKTFYNALWAQILGYELHEIETTYDSWAKLVHPDDYPEVLATLNEHLCGNSSVYRAEYRIRHRDGHWIRVLGHGRVYDRGPDGTPLRAAGIHKDITGRKTDEQALLLSREMYKHTVELTTQIPWVAGPDGAIIGCDLAWEIYTGLPIAAALRNEWLEAIHPDDREPMFARWKESIATGQPYRVANRLRHQDGTYRYCESRAQPHRNGHGEIVRWYGTTEDIHERTVAEQMLRASEARHVLALGGARLATWDWNLRTGEVVRDAPWFRMLGFEQSEATGQSFWPDRVHPDDWKAINELWKAHCNDETQAFRAEYRIRHKSGEWRWILTHGRVVERDHEGPTRACGVNQDVTGRRQFEDALANSERFSRLLLESHRDCVALLDEAGCMLYLNPAGFRRFGIPERDDVEGRLWIELWSQENRAAIAQGLTSAFAGQFASFRAFCRPDKTLHGWWDVLLSPVPERAGQAGRILAVARDITHLKEQEERQREGEERERLTAILENLNEGIIIAAPDGSLLLMNRAAQEMYGVDITGRQSVRCEELVEAFDASDSPGHVLSLAERPIMRAARGEAFSGCEIFFRNRSTGREWIGTCSSTPVRSVSGELLRAVLTVRDVTVERKAADEIVHANQVLHELSGQLLRLQDDERKRISRELHDGTVQVLSAATMNLTVLSGSPALLPHDFERRLASRSLELVEQSVRELRTMSYLLHPPVFEELGLIPALRSWTDGFSERTGIAVDFSVPDETVRLAPDVETALFRITQEALGNVHRHAESTTASVSLEISSDTISLEIADDGKGFEAMALAKHKFGVGLLGMRERASQLGGFLTVGSQPGRTVIRVTLPVRAAAA